MVEVSNHQLGILTLGKEPIGDPTRRTPLLKDRTYIPTGYAVEWIIFFFGHVCTILSLDWEHVSYPITRRHLKEVQSGLTIPDWIYVTSGMRKIFKSHKPGAFDLFGHPNRQDIRSVV
jgi:hypothetical protein